MISTVNKSYYYLVVLVCLVIIATMFSSGYSRDSSSYVQMFNVYGLSGWDAFGAEIFHREVFLLAVVKVFYQLGFGSIFLFFIYSSVSISVKLYLIDKFSRDKWLSLAFYISYFFILLDSTQIRFGLAVTCVYLGLKSLSENKKLRFSLVVIVSSLMFHVASLLFIVMLFFSSRRSLRWLFYMVIVAIVLYPVNLHFILVGMVEATLNFFELQGTFVNKLHGYLLKPSSDVFLGMFTPITLLVYFCAIILYQYKNQFNDFERLCYNSFILSIFFYVLLKDIPDLQVRFGDMFGFSLVFLVPFVHRGVSEYVGVKNAYIILYSFFVIHLIKYTLYDKMLVV